MINKKTFLNYLLLFFWMGVIYYLSNQPDLKSGFESQTDFILRKMAHITEYGILTFLAWRAFAGGKEILLGSKASKWPQVLIFAIIFAVLYAVSDEYHQTFVAGRVGSPIDVMIDSVGIVVAGIGVWKKFIKL